MSAAPTDEGTAKATVKDVAEALGCGRWGAARELARSPYTLEHRGGRPTKVFATPDLPEEIRTRVEYYLTNGQPQPREIPAAAGPSDLDTAIRAALERAINTSRKSRERIAREMSELIGRKVTTFMLDAYTAQSRTKHNFPFQLALAFEIATGSHNLTRLLVERRGCGLVIGEDIDLVALARIEREKLDLEARAQTLKASILGAAMNWVVRIPITSEEYGRKLEAKP